MKKKRVYKAAAGMLAAGMLLGEILSGTVLQEMCIRDRGRAEAERDRIPPSAD